MSTETTNKKIKIDNGTTFGRTYTDKAVDELLKNAGGGGNIWYDLTSLNGNSITQEQYNEIKSLIDGNRLAGIKTVLQFFPLVYENNGEFKFSIFAKDYEQINSNKKLTLDNIYFTIKPDLSITNTWDTTPVVELTKNLSSQSIPSIKTDGYQQNLTIGNGLEIKDGALDIKSNVVKINTYSININKTEISTTEEVGILSFAESAKTKNTALFNLLAQNENNILNIKVKLNLVDGTSFLIFMDYHKASSINFENIQGIVLKGTSAIDTHVFCVDDYRSNQNLQEYYSYLSSVDVIVNYY